MAKRLEDIVPARRGKKRVVNTKPAQKIIEKYEISKVEIGYSKNGSRRLLWFFAFVSAVICSFAVSFLFSKANIVIIPKTTEINLNQNFSADKDQNSNRLAFRLIVVSAEESKKIEATDKKDVAIRATGAVVIFNSYSSLSQILSIDTRLEGSNGKIYKTQAKTVVPGMSQDGTPGKVEVDIYATEAGEEYNSGPLDFTIVGFKDTPKYSKFVVRSKAGTEISGGYKGQAPVVSDTDKANVVDDLKNTLQEKLLVKSADYPDDFILFDGATFINIDDSNIAYTYGADNSMTVSLNGNLHGFLLNKQKLTEKIAQNNIDNYDDSEIYISNLKNLIFLPADKEELLSQDVQNINFNLSGVANIVWKVKADDLIADLLGMPKKDFSQIISLYNSIDSASLSLTPMWRWSMPEKIKDIHVLVNYPE